MITHLRSTGDDDLDTIISEAMAARRAATFSARSRELTELMAAQQALADMTRERDEAVAQLAAVTTDRNAWRATQAARLERRRAARRRAWLGTLAAGVGVGMALAGLVLAVARAGGWL